MPSSARQQRNTGEERERSTKVRPGRVRPTNTSPRRVTGTAKNLLRLARLVSRASSRSNRASSAKGPASSSSKTSPFQRRAIVNVRYSNAKTPGGWKAHGTYIERESAKARDVVDDKQYGVNDEVQTPSPDRLGLAQEHSLDSLAGQWQKAGDERIFKIIISPEDPAVNFQRAASDMIARIEQHTGAPVEWAGVVHRNTDHPHAHLIVRGNLDSAIMSGPTSPRAPFAALLSGLRALVCRCGLAHGVGDCRIRGIELHPRGAEDPHQSTDAHEKRS